MPAIPRSRAPAARSTGPSIWNVGDVAALAIADDTPLAFVTQTTLSVDDTRAIIAALRRRFTDLVGPDTKDICYATQNRQTAVRELSKLADVILVVGASNSSNSNRLREIGLEEGVPSYLVGSGAELDPSWVEGAEVVGITAGASAGVAILDIHSEAGRALEAADSAMYVRKALRRHELSQT